jgi:hypothetical protein
MSARRRRKLVKLAKDVLICSLALLIFIFSVGEISAVITKTQHPSNVQSPNSLSSGSPSNATAPGGESKPGSSGSQGSSAGSVTVLPRGGGT